MKPWGEVCARALRLEAGRLARGGSVKRGVSGTDGGLMRSGSLGHLCVAACGARQQAKLLRMGAVGFGGIHRRADSSCRRLAES